MPRAPEESRQIAYQVRRYMDHLREGDLEQRAKDIFFNRAVGAGVDALANPPPTGWEHLWRDVVDEAYRRFGDVGGAAFVDKIAKQFNANRLVRRLETTFASRRLRQEISALQRGGW